MTIQTLIYIIFAGIGCALIYTYYTRRFLGDLIRRLNEKKIHNADSSLTLGQLGYGKTAAFLLNISLGESSSLMKYLKGYYTSEQLAVLRDKGICQRYYLPEDTKDTALKRYDGNDVKLWKVLCGIVACIVTAIICAKVFPYVISMAEGQFSGSDNKNSDVIGTRIEETVTNTEETKVNNKEAE